MKAEEFIYNRLIENQDLKYREFHTKLLPGTDAEKYLGVRVPVLRNIAKEIINNGLSEEFIAVLPHRYFEENHLHSFIISQMKDYDTVIRELDRFLPYVDNWAVCDSMNPKIFRKNKEKLIVNIKRWIASGDVYTVRFGVNMLMGYFLDDDFKPEYNELVASINSDEYYLKMVVAWYFATALAKQWDETVSYVTERRLSPWVHRKTIQKAVESYRISDEEKAFLKTFRNAD